MKKTIILPALICILGCSPYHTYYHYSYIGYKGVKINSVIVAPLNVFIGMPKKLEGSSGNVYNGIVAYLELNHKKIITVDSIGEKWEKIENDVGGFYNQKNGKLDQEKYYKELLEFIRKIALSSNADAVIIPEVVVREAKVAGDRTYWDGVSRKIEIGDQFASPDRYNFTGSTLALSLKIEIFNNEGEQVFLSFGGIETHLVVPFKENSDHMKEKDNVLENKEMIVEAIQIAHHPFIRYDGYPENPKFPVMQTDKTSDHDGKMLQNGPGNWREY